MDEPIPLLPPPPPPPPPDEEKRERGNGKEELGRSREYWRRQGPLAALLSRVNDDDGGEDADANAT